jgi:hypothetical protein
MVLVLSRCLCEHIGLLAFIAKQADIARRLRNARLRALAPTALGDNALVIAEAVKLDGGLPAHLGYSPMSDSIAIYVANSVVAIWQCAICHLLSNRAKYAGNLSCRLIESFICYAEF